MFNSRDRRVPQKDIQILSNSSKSDTGDQLVTGMKVTAKCKGSTRFYPGKVKTDNGDGTYHIVFDDGDRDKEVPLRNIKLPDGSKPTAGSDVKKGNKSDNENTPKFREEERVNAKCKGSAKFYPGKIKTVNDDDTYDILFDDGDRYASSCFLIVDI